MIESELRTLDMTLAFCLGLGLGLGLGLANVMSRAKSNSAARLVFGDSLLEEIPVVYGRIGLEQCAYSFIRM